MATISHRIPDRLPAVTNNQQRHSIPMVKEGLKIINPNGDPKYADVEREMRETSLAESNRIKYSPMRAHRELAAQVLAVGGTQTMAAAKAGVSPRQIRKYYENPDFRQRIEELRNVMLSTSRGRLIAEMERRTDPAILEKTELMDFLRMYDRVMGPAKGAVNVLGDVNVNNQYDTFLQALLTSDSGAQEEDFQSFIIDGTAVSSGDTPF